MKGRVYQSCVTQQCLKKYLGVVQKKSCDKIKNSKITIGTMSVKHLKDIIKDILLSLWTIQRQYQTTSSIYTEITCT